MQSSSWTSSLQPGTVSYQPRYPNTKNQIQSSNAIRQSPTKFVSYLETCQETYFTIWMVFIGANWESKGRDQHKSYFESQKWHWQLGIRSYQKVPNYSQSTQTLYTIFPPRTRRTNSASKEDENANHINTVENADSKTWMIDYYKNYYKNPFYRSFNIPTTKKFPPTVNSQLY